MATLKDIVAGYKLVNEWEREEEKRQLPLMTVQDGLHRYFELLQLAHEVTPDLARVLDKERIAYLIEWHEKLHRAARAMVHQNDCQAAS
jgi:hypothetical protein